MRVNVYHEELTKESAIAYTEPRSGVRYCGIRFFQHSTTTLHHHATDDDRSAVTFWMDSLEEAEEFLAAAMKTVADERARVEGETPDHA